MNVGGASDARPFNTTKNRDGSHNRELSLFFNKEIHL